jgi:hypothetical protein
MSDIYIVFTPKNQIYNYSRFLISRNRLAKYISQGNVNKVLTAIENQKTNKATLKFRKYGKIEIYLK